MARIGGLWPQVQYVIDVMTTDGFEEVITTLYDVPFAGDWDRDTDDVSVGCLWSPRELLAQTREAQNWSDCAVVQDTEEQEQLVNERLNIYLKDEPWTWLLSPPNTPT